MNKDKQCRFSNLTFFLLIFQTLPSIILSFNTTIVLQEIFEDIFKKQDWDINGVNLSNIELSRVRFGNAKRYEFKIRYGKDNLLFKFPDEVDSWSKRRFRDWNSEFGDFVREIGSTPKLDAFRVEGPVDLWVSGDDRLSLQLPVNKSRSGLKRVLIGEGIIVDIVGAQQISFIHAFDRNLADRETTGFWGLFHSLSMPLLVVHVTGSASVAAYRSRNPDAPISTKLLSENTIKLLPDKCYNTNNYKIRVHPIHSLTSRINKVERLMGSILQNGIIQNDSPIFLKANMKALTIIRFQLELQRSIGSNETLKSMPEWRTRPSLERVWFDVIARVEGEKLVPLLVKKVKPFDAVDSTSWSNLMSNISFTKFPSILVHPEALTLDVKW